MQEVKHGALYSSNFKEHVQSLLQILIQIPADRDLMSDHSLILFPSNTSLEDS